MSLCDIPTDTFCYNLKIDLVYNIAVADEDLVPVDLTGTIAEINFVFREDESEFTLSSLIVGDGLDITDPIAGEITLSLTIAEANIIFDEGFYDAKLLITDSLNIKDHYLDIFFQVAA